MSDDAVEQRREPAEERPQREPPVEEIVEEMFNRHPMTLFSFNTHAQATALQELGNGILEVVEKSKLGDGSLDGVMQFFDGINREAILGAIPRRRS